MARKVGSFVSYERTFPGRQSDTMFASQASSDSAPPTNPTPDPGQLPPFMGYYRADGRVGTRNYWLVVPLFTGESQQLILLKEALPNALGYTGPNPYVQQVQALREQYRAGSYFQAPGLPGDRPALLPLFANIDGVKFLPTLGFAASAAATFWPVLAGYCAHPNVGGITLLCQDRATHVTDLLRTHIERQYPAFAKPMLVAERTTYPTEYDWLAAATHDTFQAMTVLNRQTRQPAPLSRLTIGVRCEQATGVARHPAVDQYTRLLAEMEATVLLANVGFKADAAKAIHGCTNVPLVPERGLMVVYPPGNVTEVTTTLTAAGCTLHVCTMALPRPVGNPIAPVAHLATLQNEPTAATDVAENGDYLIAPTAEAILHYSLKIASGNAQTPTERRGMDDFRVYRQ